MESASIGKKIRYYRQLRGVTQMVLADRIGVTYQQIQKYEKDRSQITLNRLFLIAKALDAPVQAFIAENIAPRFSEKEKSGKYSAVQKDERILLRLFASIKSPQVKRSVLRLVESIVAQQLRK